MLQAQVFDGLSFDPFCLQQDGLAASEVDVGGSEIVEALIATMVVALDEGGYLPFEIIRQEVVLEQAAVLQRLMPTLDFALGLGVVRSTAGMIHVALLPQNATMPELVAGTLVAIPLRDKRLEATQVTLEQLAARSTTPSSLRVAELLVDRMKEQTD